MRFLFRCICMSFLLVSCEKTVNIQPENQLPVLVVDAEIENGQPPIVRLSYSVNYFSKISPEILLNSFVRNANVTITDGSVTRTLKEYSVPLAGGYSIFYYSTENAQLPTFTGAAGKKYTLKIQSDGKEYTTETSIPNLTKTIDSLWWKPSLRVSDTTRALLMAKVTDPPGYGNYIRYFTRVNSGRFLPGLTSAFDDQIVDGKTYEIQVDQGVNRNEKLEFEDYGFFNKGDTVTVKFCNIDKATYDFWRTIEFGYQSVGNPFSSPVKVLGNVSNGALGAFSGYAVQYKTLIIPK